MAQTLKIGVSSLTLTVNLAKGLYELRIGQSGAVDISQVVDLDTVLILLNRTQMFKAYKQAVKQFHHVPSMAELREYLLNVENTRQIKLSEAKQLAPYIVKLKSLWKKAI